MDAVILSLLAAGVMAPKPIVVRVLVLNYDPVIEAEGGKRLHEVAGWNDPRKLTQGYVDDLREVSHGRVQIRIDEWRDLDEWPKKTDGFRYTDEGFLDVIRKKTKMHEPDGADYAWTVRSTGADRLMDAGKFDELWVFGAPFMGYWESAMAGPGAFFINGGEYPDIAKKRWAIMGFSYERGVAEMIHNLCHRAENHLKRVYGSWNEGKPLHAWDAFSARFGKSPVPGVGNCHFPPNGEKDYDYANPRLVPSNADDWLNDPRLTGKTTMVNCETWGGPDYQRNYLKWWYKRLPHAEGKDDTGRPNDWWQLIFRFNDYDAQGKPLR